MNLEFEIIFSPKAVKDFKKLDKPAQIRIKNAVEELAWYPPKGDIAKLKGGKETEFRLRVGDWRVIFEYQFKDKQVHILAIKHRGTVYKK